MRNTSKIESSRNRLWRAERKEEFPTSYLDARSTYQGTPTQMFTSHPDVLWVPRISAHEIGKPSLRALSPWAQNSAAVFCYRTAATLAAVLLMLNGRSS